MQRALLIILLCLPQLAAAQTWTIAAAGGVVMNTTTSRPVSGERTAGPGGVASLQAGYIHNHWEAGLGAAFRRYAVGIERDLVFEDDFDPLTGTVKSVHHMRWLETFPAVIITPFVSRHFGNGRADWFAGASAGYAIMLQQQIGNRPEKEYIRAHAYKNGFTAGVHAGCAYRLRKAWSLRAGLGADGLWLNAFSLQDVAVSAGLQYRIK